MAKKGSIDERAPMALYRKYRPSDFSEVRGQAEIVSVLEAAVKGGKIAHAYLFAGGARHGQNINGADFGALARHGRAGYIRDGRRQQPRH